MIDTIRIPAVSGMFYPATPHELRNMIRQFLEKTEASDQTVPKAIIVPHAGYIYSGAVAASAYVYLKPLRERITRVVLLGPSHRVPFLGLATSSMQSFATPLGDVPLDRTMIEAIQQLPQVSILDQAHAREHSLEVHLPFLQEVLATFKLVPLVVGDATIVEVSEVLEQVWGGNETLIVVSSDLSHYLDYESARQLDALTTRAIENLYPEKIHHEQACGRNSINGLLHLARQRGMHVKVVDVRNSGDTAGSKDRVVGYGAYVFN